MAVSASCGSEAFGSESTIDCATLCESRKVASGNRPPPSSIARASRPRIVVGPSADMMRASESTGGNGISWSIRSACLCWSKFTRRARKTATELNQCLGPLANRFTKLRKIWADSIYNGGIAEWVRALRQRNRIDLEIVKRTEGATGFQVIAKRWVVEEPSRGSVFTAV